MVLTVLNVEQIRKGFWTVLGVLAGYGLSRFDDPPAWFMIVIVAVIVLIGAAALITLPPVAGPVSQRPRIGPWLAWLTVPDAERRLRLARQEAVPVSKLDFFVAWQGWCDDVTALLRGSGFPHPEQRLANTSDPTAKEAVQKGYHGDLRNRGLFLLDEGARRRDSRSTAPNRRLMPYDEPRRRIQRATTPDELWALVDHITRTYTQNWRYQVPALRNLGNERPACPAGGDQ
jgi:hypothetical protein